MSSAVVPPPPSTARAVAPVRQAPRPGYLQLRANVHRKLLDRLNLEALAQTDRPRAESEIRALLSQLLAEETMPLSLPEREGLFVEPASAAGVAGLKQMHREGLIPQGATVTCVLTGHGLKDPDTALSQMSPPESVAADADTVASALHLT